ncbi:hypothetical protein [Pseudoalteromonas sp. R3]|uniref:hypothetical protein n=1 Tax=Pseudoalteromonas sp. R3 TaxID=1709477 RepID=UPI000A62977E|nr:hypothetical protein [Pseudoalteromonas sp. R3]AZZ96248.1 hypothetical protein ELR70_03360 [Pseudoalteromonas sp. R3]
MQFKRTLLAHNVVYVNACWPKKSEADEHESQRYQLDLPKSVIYPFSNHFTVYVPYEETAVLPAMFAFFRGFSTISVSIHCHF